RDSQGSVSGLEREGEGCPKVVVVGLQPLTADDLASTGERGFLTFGERQIIRGMTRSGGREITGLDQTIAGERPDGLEQVQPVGIRMGAAAEQAMVCEVVQRLQDVEALLDLARSADRLCRFQREAAREDGEPLQTPPCCGLEQ